MEKSKKEFELDPKGEVKCEVNLEETIRAVIDSTFKKERLYFDLLAKVPEYAEVTQKVSSNVMKMSMDDQIRLLKSIIITGRICEKLAEKYNFDELCEEGE